MDFDDPKEFDDPQVLDSKGTSLGGIDFHNPKSYVDTSFFDGLDELKCDMFIGAANILLAAVNCFKYSPMTSSVVATGEE